MNQAQAVVIVAAELRLFLRPSRRSGPVAVVLDGTSSLGHVMESLGVPLTEAGRLLVNGEPAAPGYRPCNADVVTVEAVQRPQQLAPARFVLDVYLGTLARRLRLVGVDAAYGKDAGDDALIEQANADRRVLLTQDRGLLRRRALWLGAARLDARVPAGVAAVVRLSGTGLPVVPTRGCRHSKMIASCPSGSVASGRSSSAGGQAARHLTAPARRPGGQQRTREAARWPLMRYGDVQPPPPVPPAGASPCPAVLPETVRLPPAGRVTSTRRAWAFGEAGMVTCRTPSA